MRTNCIFNLKSENMSISTKCLLENKPNNKNVNILFEPLPDTLRDIKESFSMTIEYAESIFSMENTLIINIKPSVIANRFLISFIYENYIEKAMEKPVEKESYIPSKVKIRKQKLYAKP